MKKLLYLLILLTAFPCRAQIKEYNHLYDINLDEEIPMVWRLQKEYKKEYALYDWHYDYSWNIPPVFDSDFRQKITRFGAVEKRLENEDEENLLRTVKRTPKEFYPYIGPSLHKVRGLSGKILDLPGIKETKNKFPEKIASVFQDIPYIEFTSPELYPFLMPQIWGEDLDVLEFPVPLTLQSDLPNVKIKPEFIKKLHEKIRPEDYAVDKPRKPKNMGIRHFNADLNTPLSSADVEAFTATLDGLREFKKNKQNEIRLILMDSLIHYWDEKNGTPSSVAFLKGAVNPCQAIVRKIKWTGLRSEFQDIIGKQSFGLDDWAYTCDKTIKAYRVANISHASVTSLKILRKGYLYKMIDVYDYTPEEKQQHKYFLEATIRLFDTDINDVNAVRPFRFTLQKKLAGLGSSYAGTPILLP